VKFSVRGRDLGGAIAEAKQKIESGVKLPYDTHLEWGGEINQLWDKWLGPKTEYQLVRTEQVVPLSQLRFTPVP